MQLKLRTYLRSIVLWLFVCFLEILQKYSKEVVIIQRTEVNHAKRCFHQASFL